jgi:hypothetical protein
LPGELGVYRLDNPNARLVDFSKFRQQMQSLCEQLSELATLRLHEMSEQDVELALTRLELPLNTMQIVLADWPLVAASKLLHHLLPHLVPPVDRRYTLTYFVGRPDDSRYLPSYTFGQIMRAFWKVAIGNAQELATRVVDGWEGPGAWNTTIPKLIDNAVFVGKRTMEKP